jgi:hypothetical protein
LVVAQETAGINAQQRPRVVGVTQPPGQALDLSPFALNVDYTIHLPIDERDACVYMRKHAATILTFFHKRCAPACSARPARGCRMTAASDRAASSFATSA